MNQQKTPYRAVKGSLGKYYLQFLLITQRSFLWWSWTRQKWQYIPDPAAEWLGFVSQQNSNHLATRGYGYCLSGLNEQNLRWFAQQYPNIDAYFEEFNRRHRRYLQDQERENQKPSVINF